MSELIIQILAASIRTVNHACDSARIGADVMTAPPAVIKAMINHPLTDKGLAQFLDDINAALAVVDGEFVWGAGHGNTCDSVIKGARR